ncbi:neurotrophin 1 isoform X1 [Drosophila sulfurigaster albostrigata]|uniref:neurotrophin 1 isoform X1 n=1 Tax=Drosophila sulfurigaster albostrigata TaxID=89887 RepID=UPI002D21E681|nr:neurotrophin 1 isoform X1 [Drosophila sulfurigaster albostrigata]XP_062133458.1 neurotrophin 1 isoform X1 [Drosophila sulfurigaster albostrigata]
MKAGRAFGCLFWALLYCVLYLDLTNASEDELLDFDFADAKDMDTAAAIDDWQLEDEQQAQQTEKKLEDNMLDFSVDLDEPEPEKQLPPFDWREKVLRTALAKALTDRVLRQKFAEVMPILRVLSSQQRLALSALISAQMNAKQGHELRLEQVRMMFGDDKKLLLPIVFDLANLVKSSARKYIQLGSDLAAAALRHTPLQKRKDVLTVEETQQDDSVGTIDMGTKHDQDDVDSIEDFFDEMQSEMLDPQLINEALQATPATLTKPSQSADNNATNSSAKRVRRAANEFVHKLTRSVPISVSEQQLMGGAAGRTIKLNTTAFQQPPIGQPASSQPTIASETVTSTTLSYEEIEDLAFAGLNGTEVPLIAADERNYQLNNGSNSSVEEPLPSPEELIAGPRYRLNSNKRHSQKTMPPIKRKRVPSSVHSRGRPKTSASSHNPVVVSHKKCERFTNNMCIRADDYPLEQIMGSIRRHKNAMSALLAEFYDKPNNNLEFGDEFDDYLVNKKRREDEGSAGGMCQSVVRYARPQKAKAASGEWKYIVNTGQHTQTLRLEKCSNPGESCSYLAQSYRSHCSQVYNYHRLLSWDKVRGLHVDIFKVPTCCSCQVDGYRQQFPPLASIQSKDYTPISNYKLDNGNNNGYSTINEEDLDYNDESDEDELGSSYSPYGNRDNNELSYLGSKKVRSKVPAPSSVGPYLSPPDDEDQYGSYKSHKSSSSSSVYGTSSSSKKYYNQLSRRRPQHNEPRVDVDLDLSPSETQAEQEVNVFGPPLAGEQQRVPLKRKRIYTSNTHTAAASTGAAAASGGAPPSSARLRIPISQQPQSTAATSSLPARTGTAAIATLGVSISAAPHAHQTAEAAASGASVAPSGTAATSNVAFGAGQQRYYTSSKSRPRYYAPVTTTTDTAPAPSAFPASSATPLPTTFYQQKQKQQQQQQQHQQSTALPQPPHVNSIYGENGIGNGNGNGTRRINYSYHPIIDFFEKNRRAEAAATAAVQPTQATHEHDYEVEESRRIEQRYPPASVGMGGIYQHAIPTPHERRIGFGAGMGAGAGGAAAAGGVGGAGNYGFANDNAWQPLVVDH